MTKRTLRQVLSSEITGQKGMDEVLGYPAQLDIDDYYGLYERNDIASKIVDAYPDATWRTIPKLESEIEALSEGFWSVLGDDTSMVSEIKRADKLAQMGEYSILYLGFDDNVDLAQPVEGVVGLNYLKAYGRKHAEIHRWDMDLNSPRFGAPTEYKVRMQVGDQYTSKLVHYSRVIHIAEKTLDNPYVGIPRLQQVYNRLHDMKKVAGGSAEAFWINAAMILAFEAESDANFDKDGKQEIANEIDEMMDGLRRYIRLQGVQSKVLSATVGNPKEHFEIIISLIGGSTGIPKRIFIGSEMGELASSQDEHNWISRNQERRETYGIPIILTPLVKTFQKYGILPEGEFYFDWSVEDMTSAKEKAEVAQIKSSALASYTNAMMEGGDMIVSPEEFREWLGLEEELPDFDGLDEEGLAHMPSAITEGPTPKLMEPAGAALAGPQITSLREIAMSVVRKELDPDSAIAIIAVAFPMITEAQAKAIIDPLENFEKPKEEVASVETKPDEEEEVSE